MDDQFSGRIDDDLFADDFEPIEDEQRTVVESAVQGPLKMSTESRPAATADKANIFKSLGQSRHNVNRPAELPTMFAPTPKKEAPKDSAPTSTICSRAIYSSGSKEKDKNHNADKDVTISAGATANPAIPAASRTDRGGNARVASGANPRTKLTEAELAEKMEKMRILSAEKTARFEKEQRDESEHAVEYARDMEKARRRRAAQDERRRRDQEGRRRMDEERAQNRQRKLQAMSGGADRNCGSNWDEGKQERLLEEERRGFRGVNGGVRGEKGGALAGSQYSLYDPDAGEDQRDSYHYDDGERRGYRGRGRGRGRGGRVGRGGRGGFTTERVPTLTAQKIPSQDDFPSLPAPSAPLKHKASSASGSSKEITPIFSPDCNVGKWDEEVE